MGAVYNRYGGGESTPPVLINKTINANGTYNASSDNADGYAQVTVDINAARTLLWSGSSSGNVSVDLSSYDWVYIVVTGGSALLLQVGGSTGYVGLINNHMVDQVLRTFGTARGYKATSSGITAETVNYSATEEDSEIISILSVYGISNF